ncbi:MAG TPA: hypothetical protein VJQ25_09110, partial [Nitrospira sp.]|nr:hypothetical protein [Nitrospira sp.]
GLARKQLLMTRLVKAGVQLFATEALLWYASQQVVRDHVLADELLQHFCSQVKEGFHPTPLLSLRQPLWQDDSRVFHLARNILAGKAEWLEEGILAWSPVGHSGEDQLMSTMKEQMAGFPAKH